MIKKYFLLVSLVYVFAGCNKNSNPVEHDSIVGNWKLTESYMDPGDGSGTWQPASPAHPQYLQFNSDGSVTGSIQNLFSADHYRTLNDSVIVFIRQATDSITMRYEFLKSRLEIYPPCIEGCGFKYIAVQ